MGKNRKSLKVSHKKEREGLVKALREGKTRFDPVNYSPDNFENGEELAEEVVDLLERQR